MFLQRVKFSVKEHFRKTGWQNILQKMDGWTDLHHSTSWVLRNSIPGFSRYSKLASVHVLSKKLG